MEIDPKIFNYQNFTAQSTGSVSEGQDYEILTVTFDKYEIKIKVSPKKEFLEILEVRVNQDFLSQRQKLGAQSYVDVDKYYRE